MNFYLSAARDPPGQPSFGWWPESRGLRTIAGEEKTKEKYPQNIKVDPEGQYLTRWPVKLAKYYP